MLAAELFGAWAVTQAAATAERRRPAAVIVVGDCQPAAGALNAATSLTNQMQALVRRARGLTPHWLAVAVPRESNTDADRLSHPAQLEEVLADARAAGLRPRTVHIPDECWAALREAATLAGGDEGARGPKRRRR
eukprot:2627151-Pleurochrysis_carterae.AAC.1